METSQSAGSTADKPLHWSELPLIVPVSVASAVVAGLALGMLVGGPISLLFGAAYWTGVRVFGGLFGLVLFGLLIVAGLKPEPEDQRSLVLAKAPD